MDHAITDTTPNRGFSSVIFSMDSGCFVEDNINLQKDPFIIEKHRRRISKLSPMMRLLIAEEFR
jgi:hypothetical protein